MTVPGSELGGEDGRPPGGHVRAGPPEEALRVEGARLTQPWLRTCPKLRCQKAPWRPTPLEKYCTQGTFSMQEVAGGVLVFEVVHVRAEGLIQMRCVPLGVACGVPWRPLPVETMVANTGRLPS